MPKASNTINGKAFEYACLMAIYNKLVNQHKDVAVISSPAYNTAKNAFATFSSEDQRKLMRAATTAAKLLFPMEPKLLEGKGVLLLQIASDAAAVGPHGDVRDVLCIRNGERESWTIGLSCKHNHEALKHPRITEGKDFGNDWMGIHCSKTFMDEITPVIDILVQYARKSTHWTQVEDKQDAIYVPILSAYLDELKRMCEDDSKVPEKLLSYFFGSNDFYKVIMHESDGTTTIEAFNMHGTLNNSCGGIKPMTKIPITKMPTKLLDASFKKDSKTTIVLTFDEGWSISMRLHNKDKRVKPTSLAWDVNLVGSPQTAFINTHSWNE